MILTIYDQHPYQPYKSPYSNRSYATAIAKIALLILGFPVTLTLGFCLRDRIKEWVIRDLVRDQTLDIWMKFQLQYQRKYDVILTNNLSAFFCKYPKIAKSDYEAIDSDILTDTKKETIYNKMHVFFLERSYEISKINIKKFFDKYPRFTIILSNIMELENLSISDKNEIMSKVADIINNIDSVSLIKNLKILSKKYPNVFELVSESIESDTLNDAKKEELYSNMACLLSKRACSFVLRITERDFKRDFIRCHDNKYKIICSFLKKKMALAKSVIPLLDLRFGKV